MCTDQPFPYDPVIPEACEAILDYMETSKQARLFTQAAVHEPGVEVSLPAYYAAPAEGIPTPLSLDQRFPTQIS